MAIYSIIATANPGSVLDRASKAFGADYLNLSPYAGLVASRLTASQVADKIGVGSPETNEGEVSGSAVVASIGSYWGRGSPTMWEWIKVKWEAHSGG